MLSADRKDSSLVILLLKVQEPIQNIFCEGVIEADVFPFPDFFQVIIKRYFLQSQAAGPAEFAFSSIFGFTFGANFVSSASFENSNVELEDTFFSNFV